MFCCKKEQMTDIEKDVSKLVCDIFGEKRDLLWFFGPGRSLSHIFY
jgi:hypothetical protein